MQESDAPEARIAVEYFVHRIRRELGALAASLGGLDALVFCGGIGENSAEIRARVCQGMEWLGLEIHPDRNAASETVISTEMSRAHAMVIRTDEEMVIARACKALAA